MPLNDSEPVALTSSMLDCAEVINQQEGHIILHKLDDRSATVHPRQRG